MDVRSFGREVDEMLESVRAALGGASASCERLAADIRHRHLSPVRPFRTSARYIKEAGTFTRSIDQSRLTIDHFQC